MKSIKIITNTVCIVLALFTITCSSLSIAYAKSDNATSVTMPWENDGAKQPKEYTFEEFNNLTDAQKNTFKATFKSEDAFNKWVNEAEDAELNPWKKDGAKQPKEYSFKEFNKLSQAQKSAFINSFKSVDEFNKWADKAQNAETVKTELPWKKDGAKKPSDYTFDEFNALSIYQKEEFKKEFKNEDEFDKWVDNAQLVASKKAPKKNVSTQDEDLSKSGAPIGAFIAFIFVIVIACVLFIILYLKRRKSISK